MSADEEELPLLEPADRFVECGEIRASGGRAQSLEHALLVPLGLQAADEPRRRVRHRLVVEIDRILGREHHPDAVRPRLLEDRQDRLLRRRHRGRGHEAVDLVHVDERAEVARPGETAHPGDDLREDQGHRELPFLLREVRQVDDRRAWFPRLAEQLGWIERGALAPDREGRRRDERVQLQSERGALLRREERIELEHAELAERGRLDLADQPAEIEVSPAAPSMLDEVREKHVLATRERFGLESDEAEEARHRALDLVAERLGLRLPRECRGVQRADQIEGDARARARRVDGELGGVPERLNPFRADARRLRAPLSTRRRPSPRTARPRARRRAQRLRPPRAGSSRAPNRETSGGGCRGRPSDRGRAPARRPRAPPRGGRARGRSCPSRSSRRSRRGSSGRAARAPAAPRLPSCPGGTRCRRPGPPWAETLQRRFPREGDRADDPCRR